MEKHIKEFAALTLAAALSDVGNSFTDIPTVSRNDYKSYGYHKKKCKSCANFNHCKMTLNKDPLANACGEYIKKRNNYGKRNKDCSSRRLRNRQRK